MKPPDRKARRKAVSFLTAFLLVTAFTFNYQSIENAKKISFPDALAIWMKGYGAVPFLSVLAFAAVICYTFERMREEKFSFRWYHFLCASVFGLLNLSGLYMYHTDRLWYLREAHSCIVSLMLWAAYSAVFLFAQYYLMRSFDQWSRRKEETAGGQSFFCRHMWMTAMILILICWLPWIVSYYPASMDWDVYRQLSSYLNITGFAHSNHDPWFSSCVLGSCYLIGKKLGSENLGIFIYVFFRDILIAAIYARVAVLLYKSSLPSAAAKAALLFYAVTPVWGAYAKHGFKDTFAAAVYCSAITEMILICKTLKSGKKPDLADGLSFAMISFVASAFRGNVIYALLPCVLLLGIVSWKKGMRACAFILPLGCAAFLLFNYSITHYGGISPASREEALSLPFQVTARIVRDHKDEIAVDEREAINGYLDFSSMGRVYDPLVSDPVKNRAKTGASRQEKVRYFQTFFKMLREYPVDGLEGLIASTYGYYAFTPKHGFTAGNWNANMTIFNWIEVKEFRPYFSGFHYIDHFESVRDLLHSWAQVWDRLPFFSITDTIAAYTWTIIILGVWLLKNRRFLELVPVMSVLLMICTCIASPVNDCFRYYAPVAATAPVLLLLCEKMICSAETDRMK